MSADVEATRAAHAKLRHPSWCDVEDACFSDSGITYHREIYGDREWVEAVEHDQDGTSNRTVTVHRVEDVTPDEARMLAADIVRAADVLETAPATQHANNPRPALVEWWQRVERHSASASSRVANLFYGPVLWDGTRQRVEVTQALGAKVLPKGQKDPTAPWREGRPVANLFGSYLDAAECRAAAAALIEAAELIEAAR